MSTAAMTHRLELPSHADTSLKASARFWFVVTVTGKLVFAFAVASRLRLPGRSVQGLRQQSPGHRGNLWSPIPRTAMPS